MISPRFIVGFSGHRNLANPGPIAQAIRSALEQLREQAKAIGGDIELFASIAYGADTLAVEAARDLGIPVHLVLPKAVETDNHTGALQLDLGFAADFWDKPASGPKTFRQQDWDRAWKQIEDARQGTSGGTLRMVRGSQSDPECYYDAGVQMLEACDALITVWNGKPAAGLGGTAEMVHHVRITEPKRALIIIDAATAKITTERLDTFASKTELRMREIEQINDLIREHCPATSASSEEVYHCLTNVAKAEAGKFRKNTVATILLHGIATIIASFAAILPKSGHWTLVLASLALFELILVVQAWRISREHKHRHTHERWLRSRFGAELVRGMRAAAAFLDPLAPQVALHKPRWNRFALTLGLMTSREVDRQTTWVKHRDAYLTSRLADQKEYFTTKRDAAAKTMNHTQHIASTATWLAPFCVFFALSYKTWHVILESMDHGHGEAPSPFTLATLGTDMVVRFLPILIPLIAGMATGLRVALDAARRTHRYGEMAERLEATSRGLAELKTETTATRTILATEEVLLDELIEWHLAEKQNAGH